MSLHKKLAVLHTATNPYEISPLAICSPVDLCWPSGDSKTVRPTTHRSRHAMPLGTSARSNTIGILHGGSFPCLAVGGPLAAPGAYSVWRLKRCRSAARARQRLNPCAMCDMCSVEAAGVEEESAQTETHTPAIRSSSRVQPDRACAMALASASDPRADTRPSMICATHAKHSETLLRSTVRQHLSDRSAKLAGASDGVFEVRNHFPAGQ